MPAKRIRYIWVLGVLGLVAAGVGLGRGGAERSFETSLYVWQRVWRDGVVESLVRGKALADGYMVNAGEVRVDSGSVQVDAVRLDWEALSRTGKPVTCVVRMGVELSRMLAEESAVEVLDALEGLTLGLAGQPGFAGLQLDYDCPTARLGDYARLLGAFRERAPGVALSITTLPTWLGDGDFPRLVQGLDHFVLQVHSIETPESIEQTVSLCDTDRIPGWLRQLRGVGTPYFIALPTYGYEVVFGRDGDFKGLVAELDWRWGGAENYRSKRVTADPVALAGVVRDLRRARPKGLRGVAWFRMPVETDRRNWPWATLQAVAAGRDPVASFRADIESPSQDLFEIRVHNTGEINTDRNVELDVDWRERTVRAYDLLSGFRENADGTRLTGPAPPIGEPALVGWFRTAPAENGQAPNLSKVSLAP